MGLAHTETGPRQQRQPRARRGACAWHPASLQLRCTPPLIAGRREVEKVIAPVEDPCDNNKAILKPLRCRGSTRCRAYMRVHCE